MVNGTMRTLSLRLLSITIPSIQFNSLQILTVSLQVYIHRGTVWCVNILNVCGMKVGRMATTETLSSVKVIHTSVATSHICTVHDIYTHAVLLQTCIICTYLGKQNHTVVQYMWIVLLK